MIEIGIGISAVIPKILTPEMVEKADKMKTMGYGADTGRLCPVSFTVTKD